MRVIVLGCATSTGVPIVGCGCDVCGSSHPKNKRTRCSLFVQVRGFNILIDTAPDLRDQALKNGIKRIDAVLYTHSHADHTHGIDELRTFNFMNKMRIPCYGNPETVENLKSGFRYIFDGSYSAGGKPQLEIFVIEEEFEIGGVKIVPVEINHAQWIIIGYRIGDMAYLTDCSGIPEGSLQKLTGLEILIIGALRNDPHPAHFSVDQALDAIAAIGPKRAYFTHMGHELDYAELSRRLPKGVMPAYDGIEFELDDP